MNKFGRPLNKNKMGFSQFLKFGIVFNANFEILAIFQPGGLRGNRCWTDLNRFDCKNEFLTFFV